MEQQQWPQQEQSYDAMMDAPQDDLEAYLNLDNIDFNFPDFDSQGMQLQDGHNQQHLGQPQQHQPGHHDSNAHIGDAPDFNAMGLNQYAHMSSQQMTDYQQDQQRAMGTPSAMDFGAQAQFQQDPGNFQSLPVHNYQQHYSVPPTPNSTDVFPGSAHFPPHLVQQGMYPGQHHFNQNKIEAMGVLTPLVSPQVPGSQHPIEVMPDYSMSGFMLSPLTSPAIYPQPNGNHVQYSHPHTAESSVAGSPIDLGIEMNVDLPNERPRKARKKATPKTSISSIRSRTVPAHRRKGSLSGLVDGVTADMFSKPIMAQPHITQIPEPNKSVSPQPLSESSMAPPPKPGLSDGFPALPGNMHILNDSNGLPPATPASIMRIRPQSRTDTAYNTANNTPYMSPLPQQQFNLQQMEPQQVHEVQTPVIASLGPGMEDLRLPDAAAPQVNISRNATPRIGTQERPTPRMLPRIASASATPAPQPLQSPLVAGIKGESKTARNPRKRNSTTSTLVSPALRPKISPSIKPLLPNGDGPVDPETHALLLASKSNYQNLVEGNLLPGVSYPADLSVNLTSKRTSHKIAEQGRRNRINTALQELAGLIPSQFSTANKDSSHDSEDGSPDGQTNGSKAPTTPTTQSSSKAATVEQATAYIKALQIEKKDMMVEIERLKQQVETKTIASA